MYINCTCWHQRCTPFVFPIPTYFPGLIPHVYGPLDTLKFHPQINCYLRCGSSKSVKLVDNKLFVNPCVSWVDGIVGSFSGHVVMNTSPGESWWCPWALSVLAQVVVEVREGTAWPTSRSVMLTFLHIRVALQMQFQAQILYRLMGVCTCIIFREYTKAIWGQTGPQMVWQILSPMGSGTTQIVAIKLGFPTQNHWTVSVEHIFKFEHNQMKTECGGNHSWLWGVFHTILLISNSRVRWSESTIRCTFSRRFWISNFLTIWTWFECATGQLHETALEISKFRIAPYVPQIAVTVYKKSWEYDR